MHRLKSSMIESYEFMFQKILLKIEVLFGFVTEQVTLGPTCKMHTFLYTN